MKKPKVIGLPDILISRAAPEAKCERFGHDWLNQVGFGVFCRRCGAKQDIDETERLRTALKRLIDEAERVTWQGANGEPPTYPHLATIIEVAKEALRTNQEDQRPYCICLNPQRDSWKDSCVICGGKIVTMVR